jgi:hypothetical protein
MSSLRSNIVAYMYVYTLPRPTYTGILRGFIRAQASQNMTMVVTIRRLPTVGEQHNMASQER